ncbi:MAG TPA: SH3 domain-containing protein [Verrucomicrobiota bacterium]|nr:SH3 domain-containing protein [Verrucomicrobiota bacterium]HNT14028.1 SH3 domain-containing protein [Verrucomicrobiota bacterium]
MKTNGWMILSATLLAGTLLVQADGQLDQPTVAKPGGKTAPPALPAAGTTASTEKPIVLSPGPATVTGDRVNVRGKAGFKGEIITQLHEGDAVTVIEEVILTKPRAGEPAQWAKIAYPATAHVWVHNSYLNADQTVKPRKLNIRTGAGENYSIVGTLTQGTPVKAVATKGNWTEIEAPAGAYAFVAARFVLQKPGAEVTAPPVVALQHPEPETPAPETTPVPEEGPLVAPAVGITPGSAMTEPAPVIPEDVHGAAPPPVVEEVWVPRTVSHEGVVKPTISIQAPTKYGLHSAENGKLINYLYSPTAQLEMSRYLGRQIIVTGQESLDERWASTPVLTIQKIYVVK